VLKNKLNQPIKVETAVSRSPVLCRMMMLSVGSYPSFITCLLSKFGLMMLKSKLWLVLS